MRSAAPDARPQAWRSRRCGRCLAPRWDARPTPPRAASCGRTCSQRPKQGMCACACAPRWRSSSRRPRARGASRYAPRCGRSPAEQRSAPHLALLQNADMTARVFAPRSAAVDALQPPPPVRGGVATRGARLHGVGACRACAVFEHARWRVALGLSGPPLRRRARAQAAADVAPADPRVRDVDAAEALHMHLTARRSGVSFEARVTGFDTRCFCFAARASAGFAGAAQRRAWHLRPGRVRFGDGHGGAPSDSGGCGAGAAARRAADGLRARGGHPQQQFLLPGHAPGGARADQARCRRSAPLRHRNRHGALLFFLLS